MLLSDARQPEVVFLISGRCFAQIFGQIVSIIVKTLGNTNLVALRCLKMKKTSLPVDGCSSKPPLLKLPFNRKYDQQQMERILLVWKGHLYHK